MSDVVRSEDRWLLTRERAERHAELVRECWKKRGVEIEVILIPLGSEQEWGVRSDLLLTANGERR
jgi:hypothetical protein